MCTNGQDVKEIFWLSVAVPQPRPFLNENDLNAILTHSRKLDAGPAGVSRKLVGGGATRKRFKL